jgi:hypothetical protein
VDRVQHVVHVLVADRQDVRDLSCLVSFLGEESDHLGLGIQGGQLLRDFGAELDWSVGSLGLERSEDVDVGVLVGFVGHGTIFLCCVNSDYCESLSESLFSLFLLFIVYIIF